MFEKLTTRERNLAYAVIGLAPAVLIFIGVFWFLGKYEEYGTREVSLMAQIDDEEMKMAQGKKADRRRAYYDSISLPANLEDASNDYQTWLKGLLRDELKMNLKTLTPTDASDLKNKTEVIGRRRYFTLRADGTLDQLTSFLSRFYAADLLHRINSIKIMAQNEATGDNKKIRTGLLGVTAKIEVLSLNTAVDDWEFLKQFIAQRATESKFAERNKAYREMVVRRDIFGPPNNSPTVAANNKSSYESGTDVTFDLTAKDADEDDEMVFELVESSVEGVKLEQPKPGARAAKITVPGQDAGRFKFSVKVSDNGFPAKEGIKDFYVTFKDPPPPEVKKEVKPDPPFINANETQLTGIVLEKSGDWQVWIKVRTTGERFKLKVGESFVLDDQKWVVEEIMPGHAVLRVDNKLLTFQPTDRFVNPRNEVILEASSSASSGDVPESGAKVDVKSDIAPKPGASTG